MKGTSVPKHPSSGKYAIVGLGVVAGQQPDRSERMIASEAATQTSPEAAARRPRGPPTAPTSAAMAIENRE